MRTLKLQKNYTCSFFIELTPGKSKRKFANVSTVRLTNQTIAKRRYFENWTFNLQSFFFYGWWTAGVCLFTIQTFEVFKMMALRVNKFVKGISTW